MRRPYRVALRHPDDIQVTTHAFLRKLPKEIREIALVRAKTREEEANDAQGMR
jgi:hypothetical protein